MSSVSPSDSGLSNYYHKTIKDLQEENASEIKRNKEHSEKQADTIEKHHQNALVKKDKETEDTVRYVRNEANETTNREKDSYNASLDELKQKTRNTNDKEKSGLGSYYHKALDDFQEQSHAEINRNKEHLEQRNRELESSHKSELRKQEKESGETIRNIKDQTQELADRDRQLYQTDLEKVKNQNYNAKGQIPGSIAPELYKKQIQGLEDETQMRHANDMAALTQVETNAQTRNEELVRKNSNQIQKLTEHQIEEVNQLEDNIKDLNDFNHEAGKRQGETVKELTLESNKKARIDQERLEKSFSLNEDKLQQELRDKDTYLGRRNSEMMKNKNTHFTNIITKQNQENFKNLKDIQDQFKSQVSQVETSRKHDQEKSDETRDHLLAQANQERQQSLERQAQGYSNTLQRTRKEDQSQIAILQKELQHQKTSDDPTLISPAAEAQVRKNVIQDYEKKFNSEIERNKSSIDHLQMKYINQYQKALEESSDKETQIHQRNAAERTFDQTRFLDTVQDTEYRTSAKMREQSSDHDREQEGLLHQFSNLMNRQRREYEHILENSRSDASVRLSSFRQESDINSKAAHRAFNTQQNEIIREYDKKLADQKTDSDTKLDDLKTQSQSDIRDNERRAKQELELQAKGFEQRVAQLEAQGKERERYMAQTYQDELDRTKRSYELASKKKS